MMKLYFHVTDGIAFSVFLIGALGFLSVSIFLVFMDHCLGFSWFWTKETDTAYIDLNIEYSKAWVGQMVSFSVLCLI